MLVHFIACDECGYIGTGGNRYTAWRMRYDLKQGGWVCGLRGARDLCPACAAEPEQEGDDDGS